MDSQSPATDHRRFVAQLAEEYSWFQGYLNKRVGDEQAGMEPRFADALLRNAIGPALEPSVDRPLHIAVVGGAGTGKSTVVNFILGEVVTESNAQAGYTRHPIAYGTLPVSALASWGSLGFLGILKRLETPTPASLDEDVYQYRVVHMQPSTVPERIVVWDCPDVTTWASQGYVRRVIEVLALADLVVFVASDERYNDDVPTRFLRLVLQAGKAVVVCLTKMKESESATILQHFQKEILPAELANQVPLVYIPFLSVEQLRDPVGQGSAYRIPLLNQLGALLQPEAAARKRTVDRAVNFLETGLKPMLEAARRDLLPVAGWERVITDARADFESTYQREFGVGSSIADLQTTPDRLLQRLDLTGSAKWLSLTLRILRQPYLWLKQGVGKILSGPKTYGFKETEVLQRGLQQWLDATRAAAVREGKNHPFWEHVAGGFQSGLGEQCLTVYRNSADAYRAAASEEIAQVSRTMIDSIDGQSNIWNLLRVSKIALEIVAIALGIYCGWFNWWILLYVPLFVSAVHAGFEVGVHFYLEQKRMAIRKHRLQLLDKMILSPFQEKLRNWPLSAGSDFERLKEIEGDIEGEVKQIAEWVRK